jgi:type III secretion protein S
MVAIIVTAGWLGGDMVRFAERAFHTLTQLQ